MSVPGLLPRLPEVLRISSPPVLRGLQPPEKIEPLQSLLHLLTLIELLIDLTGLMEAGERHIAVRQLSLPRRAVLLRLRLLIGLRGLPVTLERKVCIPLLLRKFRGGEDPDRGEPLLVFPQLPLRTVISLPQDAEQGEIPLLLLSDIALQLLREIGKAELLLEPLAELFIHDALRQEDRIMQKHIAELLHAPEIFIQSLIVEGMLRLLRAKDQSHYAPPAVFLRSSSSVRTAPLEG